MDVMLVKGHAGGGSDDEMHARESRIRSTSLFLVLTLLTLFQGQVVFAQEPSSSTLPPAVDVVSQLNPDWSLDREVDRNLYRLGPGDKLLLVLEGKSLRRIPLTVLPEGVLDWEGGLHLLVGGFSLREAERQAAEALSAWMPKVEVGLLLLEPRLVDVHVLGQVIQPGIVKLRATDRLMAAIEGAGGSHRLGSNRFVDLIADDGSKERVDLYPYLMTGKLEANLYCPSDRVIFVPARTDTVSVIGEVNRPGTFEWSAGETLEDFLVYALGFTNDALPASVLLERDEREVEIRLLDEHDYRLPMRPGDVLVVGSRRPLLNRVYLEGAGERRGELYLSPGETLGDLVRRIGDTRGSALPEQAILERKGVERDEFIIFNLKAVLQGLGPVDMPIQNEDVLYVPIRSREVFVLGEVEAPGALDYIPAWTVGQYLALAGGTTDRGSDSKLKVIGIDGIERKIKTTDHLHRGDILHVRKSNMAIISDFLLTAVSVTGLILAVHALSTSSN